MLPARLGLGAIMAVGLFLSSCNGYSPTSAAPPVTTPPSVTTVVLQGGRVDVAPGDVHGYVVHTTGAGTLRGEFGWTFADDSFEGAWSLASFCRSCTATTGPTTTIPETATSVAWTTTVNEGGYFLLLVTSSPTNKEEAVSLEVTLTSP